MISNNKMEIPIKNQADLKEEFNMNDKDEHFF